MSRVETFEVMDVRVDVDVRLTEEELNDRGWHYMPPGESPLVNARSVARAVIEEHMERHGRTAPHLCSEGVCGRLDYDTMRGLQEVHPHA